MKAAFTERALALLRRTRADYWLASMAFAEGSLSPLPTEALLLPMALARPDRALKRAAIATVASAVGALYGYAIGHYGGAIVEPWLTRPENVATLERVAGWFSRGGFGAVVAVALAPVPHRLFALGAGFLGLGIVPFLFLATLARGLRFCLVIGVARLVRPPIAALASRLLDRSFPSA